MFQQVQSSEYTGVLFIFIYTWICKLISEVSKNKIMYRSEQLKKLLDTGCVILVLGVLIILSLIITFLDNSATPSTEPSAPNGLTPVPSNELLAAPNLPLGPETIVTIPPDSNNKLEETPQAPQLIGTPLMFSELVYTVSYSIANCNLLLAEVYSGIEQLTEAFISGGYTIEACDAMSTEHTRLEALAAKLESDIAIITKWEDEYYYATKTWQFLIEKGYSEVIASALIGNMMVETTGGNLSLNPTIYNPTKRFYGLCQWSIKYYPQVEGMSFEAQLEYLHESMPREFKTFGKKYYKGFKYDDFLSMTDPKKAAIAFAKVYERCGSGSYNKRAKCAVIAYEYFNLNMNKED